MNIKTAIQFSLNSPRAGLGGAVGAAPRNTVADTLKELLEGVAEIERHARRTDPRNIELLNRFVALTAELTRAHAAAESQGRAQLGAAMKRPGNRFRWQSRVRALLGSRATSVRRSRRAAIPPARARRTRPRGRSWSCGGPSSSSDPRAARGCGTLQSCFRAPHFACAPSVSTMQRKVVGAQAKCNG